MTFEQLKELICENFGVSEDKVTETADLQEDLKLDSLDAVELSMMMEEALEMIKETSLKILDLEVKEDNLSAINLYKKFNFKEIGKYPQTFYVNQKYYDALLMNLYID